MHLKKAHDLEKSESGICLWRERGLKAMNDAENLLLSLQANATLDTFTVFEEEQGGYGPDAVHRSHVAVIIYIDLGNPYGVAQLICDFIEYGCDAFAWTAPRGPKIHHEGSRGRVFKCCLK